MNVLVESINDGLDRWMSVFLPVVRSDLIASTIHTTDELI